MTVTRCQILRLKCTKFDFRWGSAPDPVRGAYSTPPDPLAGFKGPTSKGREGRGKGWEEGRGGEREGREKGRGNCSKVLGGGDRRPCTTAFLSLHLKLKISSISLYSVCCTKIRKVLLA